MVRKLLTIGLSIFIAATLIPAAFASNGTQIGTVGARSTGMGSCFRGLADDWSAVFFNPAGLTQLGKWTIGGSTGLIMPRGSYTAAPYPVYPFSGMYTTPVDATSKNFYVPSIGIFYKPSEKFVVGVGVYAPFGLGTEWDLLYVPPAYGNPNAISKKNENYSDHQVINIQPTVAFKLSEKISVGLGVSYVWGKMVLDMINLPLNPMLDVWNNPQNPLNALTAFLPEFKTDQYRLIVENNLDGSGSAYGANLGILFDISEKLSLGISGRYATDLKLKGDMKQTVALPYDEAMVAAINNLVAGGYLTDAQGQAFAGAFSGLNLTEKLNVEADLPLPWTIGAGVAFKPSPKLTLTADASLTNWSSWGDIKVKIEGGDEIRLEENWKNTVELGGGFEFLAVQKESSKFFVRGGFYTVNTPAPDETMSPTILDPNRRYIITGGLGLNLGKISFNLAYENVLFKNKDVKEYVFDPATGAAENYAGLYKFHATVITFGTSIGF